jgi:hypothetical protein
MSRPRSRGSVLALSLVMLLLTFSLVGSLLAVAAARCRAIARESRRAQALALAESAVSVAQARLAAGQLLSPVSGALATGRYSAQVTRTESGRVVVKAVGTPLALVGGTGTVTIEATLARQGGRWRISAWQEVE